MDPVPPSAARLRRPRHADAARFLRRLASLATTGLALACTGGVLRPVVAPADGAAAADRAGVTAPAEDAGSEAVTLRFRDAAGRVETRSLRALRRACGDREVEVDDPYHARRMRYAAMELRCVLDEGFAGRGGAAGLREQGLLLRALDGYTRPVSGRELLEPGGHLAFGEPDRLAGPDAASAFSPIDRRQVDPAPFYMVWTGIERADPHETPWPYQLAEIAIAPFEEAFPATVPRGLASGDPGWVGYRLFQRACASCHSINGQGGKIGPDLNVPRSIVEYRPVAQIRAYIRDPQTFRYTSMPAHPELAESDLDALIAYFEAMQERKQDPLGAMQERKQDPLGAMQQGGQDRGAAGADG